MRLLLYGLNRISNVFDSFCRKNDIIVEFFSCKHFEAKQFLLCMTLFDSVSLCRPLFISEWQCMKMVNSFNITRRSVIKKFGSLSPTIFRCLLNFEVSKCELTISKSVRLLKENFECFWFFSRKKTTKLVDFCPVETKSSILMTFHFLKPSCKEYTSKTLLICWIFTFPSWSADLKHKKIWQKWKSEILNQKLLICLLSILALF